MPAVPESAWADRIAALAAQRPGPLVSDVAAYLAQHGMMLRTDRRGNLIPVGINPSRHAMAAGVRHG